MKLQKKIASISPALRKKAELLLKSENFASLKNFGDGFEAFIGVEGGILLPEVILDEDGNVLGYECQCGGSRRICVHVAAVLLGIEKMLPTGCDDYHEAIRKLEPDQG